MQTFAAGDIAHVPILPASGEVDGLKESCVSVDKPAPKKKQRRRRKRAKGTPEKDEKETEDYTGAAEPPPQVEASRDAAAVGGGGGAAKEPRRAKDGASGSSGETREADRPGMPRPNCGHNSWDNVRVIKGQVTLRCRVCQVQWRTHVDAVWRKRKCGFFNTASGCNQGHACAKLHLHPKKQSLTVRYETHGEQVLTQVPTEVIPGDVHVHGKVSECNPPGLDSTGSSLCSGPPTPSPTSDATSDDASKPAKPAYEFAAGAGDSPCLSSASPVSGASRPRPFPGTDCCCSGPAACRVGLDWVDCGLDSSIAGVRLGEGEHAVLMMWRRGSEGDGSSAGVRAIVKEGDSSDVDSDHTTAGAARSDGGCSLRDVLPAVRSSTPPPFFEYEETDPLVSGHPASLSTRSRSDSCPPMTTPDLTFP
ncbi:hypothetical protein DIPPA_02401 [Diplonema papillatum]|nr:hypothetical protein DIPPA_02401 [Diplonema papillatum]